ncbi:MAG: Hpt domain-containing protein [Betaproteobacteria bacterium]|nr:Hpt domain-containing protein [Betaproteobacteria bacterium]MDH5221779.1 Hpt domain-containing protein [Betaproteobacteria bacterium]MDH5351494.1 Hpt domain-containing protein [Betaproteobacteria bacterium]
MTDATLTVTVAKDLEDLIPVFMTNRAKEVETLRGAVAAGDFEQLKQLGHRMKGVGRSYGFIAVSDIGKRIEDAAAKADRSAIASAIGEYADYLSKVKVVYE